MPTTILTKPFDRRRADRPHPGDRPPLQGPFGFGHQDRQAGGQPRHPHRRGQRLAAAPTASPAREYGILELLEPAQGHDLTKEMFLNHLYGGMDEPELEDHRRLRLQAPQEASTSHRRRELYRDGLGLRLPRDPEAAGANAGAESAKRVRHRETIKCLGESLHFVMGTSSGRRPPPSRRLALVRAQCACWCFLARELA